MNCGEPCHIENCPDCLTAWREAYGAVVESDASVICDRCGRRVEGDGEPVPIVCFPCFQAQSA